MKIAKMKKKPKKKINKSNYERLVKTRLEEIEEWSSKAMTHRDMAKALGVSYNSFRTYKEEHEELQKALDDGKIEAIAEVEGAVFKRAVGYTYEEKHSECRSTGAGETIIEKTVTKHQPGDTLAMMYFLNNRAPEKWKAKREENVETDMNVNITFVEDDDDEDADD